jgi:hypothetical protein
MQPLTVEASAKSEAFITCWYHSGKLASRLGFIAFSFLPVVWSAIDIDLPFHHEFESGHHTGSPRCSQEWKLIICIGYSAG